MSQITSDVVVDCIMEGFRRKLQSLRVKDTLSLPPMPEISIPVIARNVPFGCMRQGDKLVFNPYEVYAIVFAKRWRSEGLTLREIGRKLALHRYYTRRGGVYCASTVMNLLRY